jgi:3-phenylpropionate/cinnamic acid dioxygenase small subunit
VSADAPAVPDPTAVAEIQDLVARYARLCDDRDVDGWASLFASGARFEIRRPTGASESYAGDGIRQWLVDQQRNPAGCHSTTNVSVRSDGADTAAAESDFVFVRRVDGTGPWEIVNVGRYADRFVRRDGRWLFAERVITLR